MTEETLGTIIGITMETLGTMEIGSNVERLYG
jgi:DNA-binding XRE family transcriptional regulator